MALRRAVAITMGILAVLPPAGVAQTSRADEIAQMQAAKAKELKPYEPSAGEKIVDIANRVAGTGGTGAYPWLGSIYPGGALGLGAGYRQSVGDTGAVNFLAGWSIRNYKLARVDLKLPELAQRRIAFTTHAVWLDAPSVAFYGIGHDSRRGDRTTYQYSPATVGGAATVRLANWLLAGAGADYLSIDTAADALNPGAAPGFGEEIDYAVGRLSLGVDWRSSPGYSRQGGVYRVEWAHHANRSGGLFDFRQTEGEVVQMLPLFRGSSIIALRGLVTTTDVGDGHTVPVFMLPSLGGGTSLRGYPSWRFRDRHRLLVSAEYRWTPAQVIDMALFIDGGKVAARWRDLDFTSLKTDVGVGIRLHGPSFTALRLDVARGREGWVLNLGGGAAF